MRNDKMIQELTKETDEVATRLRKLSVFMATDDFRKIPYKDRDLLYSKRSAMSEYVRVLGKQLERAKVANEQGGRDGDTR